MVRKINPQKYSGFSLLEVVIVLAISAAMIVIVVGVFSQRKNVAAEDGVEQLVSSATTTINEAKQGLGPTNNVAFEPGETLFGQAIRFSNGEGCANNLPCMIVFKLKKSADSVNPPVFSSYERYEVANQGGVEFYNSNTTACGDNAFVSCLLTGSGQNISVSNRRYLVLTRNGTGTTTYYPLTGCDEANLQQILGCRVNATSQIGLLSQAIVYRNAAGSLQPDFDTISPTNEDTKYFLDIDMLNANTVRARRQ